MLAAGTTLGPYKILAPLGAGGMGEVYRARDTRLGRDVALKVIHAAVARDPDRIKRFEQEARAAGALSHPNVCAIYDLGTHEGSPFVVMELLEGESLREKLRAGPISTRKAIDYVAQAAHGLAAAHEKGIIHRDLKPENLFVTKDGRVKVLDFGLAKLTRPDMVAMPGEPTVSIAATETGAILGTMGYMSPEQVRGENADARSDLFALGAILYEMLAGKRAFHGATYVETLSAILKEDPQPLVTSGQEVAPTLEPIVRRCLEKSPQQRFQAASDLAFDLENPRLLAVDTGTQAARIGLSAKARSGTGYAAAFLIGAILVAGLGVLALRRQHLTDRRQVIYTRLTAQRGAVYGAHFSPDGKTVFYSAAWEGRAQEVFEVRPGFLNGRALGVSGAWLQGISSTGEMAVLVGPDSVTPYGTLAVVPISGGAARPVLDHVSQAAWGPDGRTLAVARQVGAKSRLEMPPGHVLYETSGTLSWIRIAPDGRRVGFTDAPSSGDFRRAVVVDTAGSVLARSAERRWIGGAAWSADGREFWFCPTRDLASSDLVALTTNGRERVVTRFLGLTWLKDIARDGRALIMRRTLPYSIRGRGPNEPAERELGWFDGPIAVDISGDGKWLLFNEEGAYGGSQYAVCLRGMDGSPAVKLGDGDARALSPDGRWALALYHGPPQRLMLLPTGVGDSTSLPRGPIDAYFEADWLPDGRRIVFVGSSAGRSRRTFIQDLDGGLPRPITPEGIAGAIVSPDGRHVAAVSGEQGLYVSPTTGDSARYVAQLAPAERPIQWAADGRSLYISRKSGAGLEVFKIELDGGRRVLWRTFAVPDPAGVNIWNAVLTPDGRGYAYSYNRAIDDLYLVEGLK